MSELPAASLPRRRPHYAFAILVLGTLTILGTNGFLRFGYAMILPGMRDAMGLNFAQTGMLVTVNYVGYTLSATMIGWLTGRLGPRRTVGISTTIVGLAMILTGAAQNYEIALALQAVAGAASAMAMAPMASLATPWFAKRRRGMATGAMSSGAPLGSLITGPLIPLLATAFGPAAWRYDWTVLGTAVVVFGLLDLALLRNRPADVGLTPLGGPQGAPQPAVRETVSWRQVYRLPLVWHLALLALAGTLASGSFNTFFTVYLVQERAISTAAAGQL